MKISEKSNGRILEKWLKFPSSHSDQRYRLLNFTPAFFRRFKDLETMLPENEIDIPQYDSSTGVSHKRLSSFKIKHLSTRLSQQTNKIYSESVVMQLLNEHLFD